MHSDAANGIEAAEVKLTAPPDLGQFNETLQKQLEDFEANRLARKKKANQRVAAKQAETIRT